MKEGQRIGQYEVGREIGRGGMGVVYMATDTRLGRTVAIKTLPADLVNDPERLARLDREARALASVSHPNVGAIYGVEELEGRKHLVLEYVEGETLAERLDRGALPVDEAVEVCAQIAAGLEAAHAAGVIHRDLKPGNVKITPEGQAKVLDFGLAKAAEHSSGSTPASETMPTAPLSQTVPGAVLGTAPYMSPEQARGRRVDQRSDIWSFGAVLYECLTGAGPFMGESMNDSIGAILHKDPEWSRLPAETPATVQLLLRRCLQRDAKKRLQSVGDARVELEAAMEDPNASTLLLAGRALPRRGRRGARVAAMLAGGALLAAVGVGAAWVLRPAAAPAREARLSVPLPTEFTGFESAVISPDGRTLAVVATTSDGPGGSSRRAVYVRDLAGDEFRELPGTTDAWGAKFSPSGGRLFFVKQPEGSPSAEVASLAVGGGPALLAYRAGQRDTLSMWGWTPLSDDELLAPSGDATRLYRVAASGGAPREVGVRLPEGELLFEVLPVRGPIALVSTARLGEAKDEIPFTIFRVNLDTGESSTLLEDASAPNVLDSGALLFLRKNSLFIAPFDVDRAELTGAPRALVPNVETFEAARSAGHLVCLPKSAEGGRGLIARNAAGVERTLLETKEECVDPKVSPDGERLAYVREASNGAPRVWTLDLRSGLSRPVSPVSEVSFTPSWSGDGRLIYTKFVGPNDSRLIVVAPGGAGGTPLLGADLNADEVAFSPDGRSILVSCMPADGREPGLYVVDPEKPDLLREFFASPGSEGSAAFSPDGKWVAFQTSSSGRAEVYVRELFAEDPQRAPIHPVSRGGGGAPRWSKDGKTLWYVGGPKNETLFEVTVETAPSIAFSEARVILENVPFAGYDVLPSGEFALTRSPDDADARPELRIILNAGAR